MDMRIFSLQQMLEKAILVLKEEEVFDGDKNGPNGDIEKDDTEYLLVLVIPVPVVLVSGTRTAHSAHYQQH